MFKLRSISKKDYDKYSKKNIDITSFMHSSAWGEFEKVTNNVTPHYLGLINENNKVVAATLLLEEHLPLNICNLYAPRGFIIDYKNKELLNIFTQKLKNFAKVKKATSIRINPELEYKIYDNKNNEQTNKHTENMLSQLKELNYKKKSNIKLLEYNLRIDLTKDIKEIEKNFSKNLKSKLEKTKYYNIELVEGTEKDFNELLKTQNENNKKYYETLYDIFKDNEQTKIKLFLGNLHITKTLKALEKEQKKIINQISIIPIDNLDATSKEKLTNLRSEKEKLTKDIEKFRHYKIKYGNSMTICTALFMEHHNKVWTISETNNNISTETNLDYNIYYEYIKYYIDKGFTNFYQLSPIEHNPNINKFKREFGGEFTEYIGEFDLITNKFYYFLEKKLIPFLKKEE